MPYIDKSIIINTTPDKIYSAIITKSKYEKWACEFMEGSSYIGDWDIDSKIIFTSNSDAGKSFGMLGIISENIPNKFISIKVYGMIENGVEKTDIIDFPSYECYYFFDKNDGTTEFRVIVETSKDYHEDMLTLWDKALLKLQQVSTSL
jgi:hypothetical protein